MFGKFKTNKGLWLAISATLFLLYFFFGHDNGVSVPFGQTNTPQLNEGAPPPPPTPASELWAYLRHTPFDFGVLILFGFYLLLFSGVPALIVGWFIHLPIVIFKEYAKARK